MPLLGSCSIELISNVSLGFMNVNPQNAQRAQLRTRSSWVFSRKSGTRREEVQIGHCLSGAEKESFNTLASKS